MTLQNWIEVMERMTSKVSVVNSTEPRLVAHPSNPHFYRLNCHTTDWKAVVNSIIIFLKEEKLHIDKRDVKHTLIVTKDHRETQELSKISCVFNVYSGFCNRLFIS
jgi:hypothetical protein